MFAGSDLEHYRGHSNKTRGQIILILLGGALIGWRRLIRGLVNMEIQKYSELVHFRAPPLLIGLPGLIGAILLENLQFFILY